MQVSLQPLLCLCLIDVGFLAYENPLVTATSRPLISDVHKTSRQLTIGAPIGGAMRTWSDVTDVFENETFGARGLVYFYPSNGCILEGHSKVVIEHTLHILLLPGIHHEGYLGRTAISILEELKGDDSHLTPDPGPRHPFIAPSLPVPGTSITLPSPFHLKLRIITKLSFNEQGLVTHHRDVWDAKAVVGLVPGVSLMQWVGTRVAAHAVSLLGRLPIGGWGVSK